MKNYKNGELEAKQILSQKYGIVLYDNDDNSKDNMPDFKTEDGAYYEITHTKHNSQLSRYQKESVNLSTIELLERENQIDEIKNRYYNNNYSEDENDLRIKDGKILQNYMTCPDENGHYNEFKKDIPCNIFSSQTVLDAIFKKNKKYKDKNYKEINLFCFVTYEEMDYVINEILRNLEFYPIKTVFKNIYLCSYDFLNSKYEINNPDIIIL